MEKVIVTIQRNTKPLAHQIYSSLKAIAKTPTILVDLQVNSLDNICNDGEGKLLTIDGNRFILDGECIYEGTYTDFRWKGGILAISRKHEEGYTIFIQGQVVFETSSECDWTLINGKVVASCNEGLFYNGTKILEKKDYDRWGIFDDQLVIENALGCHQVLLPEQL